jgi:hypothetical protein
MYVTMVMLLGDFKPYGTIFMYMRVVVVGAMVKLSRDFGLYEIIFMTA